MNRIIITTLVLLSLLFGGLMGFHIGIVYKKNKTTEQTASLNTLRMNSFELGYKKSLLTVYSSINTGTLKTTFLPSDSSTSRLNVVRIDSLFWKPDSLWYNKMLKG